ncbi:hypothetical protein FXN65_11095 [Metapseudomonas lalkuanensis]|uniref:Uncharacterized protein n=1 Tax=Metapseudomonas lalkuanensis TaxID=2604832 RepID=A0A5J6QPA3_9GAMM|nr:hypothetical protein [Pseudomonas lalkuanensis]QEY62596.1 hypothetical protein FXN65_11095 [Pseudomonas lalkuanensis]UCO96180.1 hypothetical protein LF844_15960 [Pseudomonas lalkuanensis]
MKRDFPGHVAWSQAQMNGDHALAFVAVKPRSQDTELHFHLVYDGITFARHSEAVTAAERALSKILGFDARDAPVFSSPEC